MSDNPLIIPARFATTLQSALDCAARSWADEAARCVQIIKANQDAGRPNDRRIALYRELEAQYIAKLVKARQLQFILIDGSACDDGRPHDWASPAYERNPTVCRRCNAEQGA